MSLSVEGYIVPSAVFHPGPHSYISSAFYLSLPRVSGTRLLVTTIVPSQLLLSTPLDFQISTSLQTDIVLGFDWSSRVRDYLLMDGYRLDSTFDAWLYFSLPSHPLYHPSGPAHHPSGPATRPITSGAQHASTTASAHPDELTRNAASGLIVPNSESYSENSENFETVKNSDIPFVPRARNKKSASIHPKTPSSSKLSFIPYVPPSAGPSQSASVPTEDVVSSVSSQLDSETRGHDAIARLFLSPDTVANIFTAGPGTIFKLLDHHHVPRPSDMSLEDGRISLICHFIGGSCVQSCDPIFLKEHICHCKNFASVFPNTNSMAFAILSIIVSASEERLPAPHVYLLCRSFGLGHSNRVQLFQHLAKHRRDLVREHSAVNSCATIFNNLDDLPRAALVVVAQSHGIFVQKSPTRAVQRDSICYHISRGKCISREGYVSSIGCSSLGTQFSEPPTDVGSSQDPSIQLQMQILRQLLPVLRLRALRRLLKLHDVAFVDSDKIGKLRRRLKSYLYRLKTGKYFEGELSTNAAARKARFLESSRLRAEWPQLVPDHVKKKLVENFDFAISRDSLSTFTCGSCTEDCPMADKILLALDDFDINLLKRPDEFIDIHAPDEVHSSMSSNTEDVEPPPVPPAQKPWLDDRCPDPPMPMANTPYRSMLIDPSSLESDPDTNDPMIAVCRRCRSDLKAGRVPSLSQANRTFLGPVPSELQGLTVVEEAMIALCRAKCWIVQLREDEAETSVPIAQRGVIGHIIVYPQRPSSIAQSLPPSLEDIISPVCVIFVGSKPPTEEWLRKKATPLIVRKERVLKALEWLKIHNHLYCEVPINKPLLNSLPDETILPFHIQHIVPSTGIDVTTSDYVPGSAQVDIASVPNLTDILAAPPPNVPFQSVVVADVDGNAPSNELRSAALRHMARPGSNYVEIPHDSEPANEFKNPHLFPMMYPTLFPYGLGGMEDKERPTKLSFKRHVKHLFSLSDRRFQEHYSFLFTAFNMLQRRALLLRTKLKADRVSFDYIAAQFGTVSPAAVHIVSERIAAGDTLTANSAEERRVLRLMKEVSVINSHVPGSAQSKLVMRNEIRALMLEKGLPSFYITINPADVYNPLVKFLAGDDINIDALLPKDIPNYLQQACTIAKNPSVAARFFNIYMKAFIKCILAYDGKSDDDEGGILGVVRAYYGTVEAQGRGTLHCHMMVWVAGGLNPNQIKEKALENGGNLEFQKRLIQFLDDTISTSIPPDPEPELETPLGKFHPCATRGPGPGIPPDKQQSAEQKDLHNLAERCQRHRHTATCYKLWHGYPAPKECRFDLDKANETPVSVFDPETGSFELRTLDGLVNNFNETMLKAIRCNMDIKFIGSGPAAKAILYYITDYITKSQLQAHVAYAALEVAVNKLGVFNPEEDDITSRAKSLLQRCAHSLISKQELSAQQVVSYLMDFEDHFTSHKYVNLFWTSLEAFIEKEDPSPECYLKKGTVPAPEQIDVDKVSEDDNEDGHETDQGHDEDEEEILADVDVSVAMVDAADLITITLDSNGNMKPATGTATQACDYQRRGAVLEDVNVWDFVAQTDKEKIRKGKRGDEEPEDDDDEPESEDETEPEWNRDNILEYDARPMPRIPFENTHLEDETHVIKVRPYNKRKVPVPIGPALPRRDTPASIEKHARLMLILFKPQVLY